MDLTLNDTQQMIRESARRLLSDALDLDNVNELERTDHGFSADLWTEIAELGWTSLALPEDIGGGGCGLVDLCVLAEELGRSAASLPLIETAGVGAHLLRAIGPSPLVTDLLGRLATTDAVIVPAFAEPMGNDQRATRVTLRHEPGGNGGGTISGTKVLVPFASAAQVMLVTLRTTDDAMAIAAIDTSTDGVVCTRHETIGAKPLFRVEFNDVAVGPDQILAQGAAAEQAIAAGLDAATVLATAEVVGNCEAIIQLAADYVTNREQFGQPIGRFQAVAHPIADMRINTDACRLLAAEAAWTIDQGRDATLEVAGTKALANEVVIDIVHAAHAVHGAIGYSTEYHLHLFTRRARAFCLSHGSTDEQTERAAAALGL